MNTVFEFTHGTTVFVLAIVHFVRQSLQMHRTTKQWKPDPYMSLLVAHNILYFIAYVHLPLIHMYPPIKEKKTHGNFLSQHLFVYLYRVVGSLGKAPDRRVVSAIDIDHLLRPRIHTSPSIHLEHSGVVRP